MGISASLPEDAKKPHFDSIKISRIISSTIAILVLIAAIAIGLFSENYSFLIFVSSLAIVFFIISWFWAKKSYQHSWWWFAEEGLYVQKGVLWRKKTLVPQNRVQHTDVSQGPLQRRYGLGSLVIHTAGTRDASVKVEDLEHAIALEIRAQLIERGSQDAV